MTGLMIFIICSFMIHAYDYDYHYGCNGDR